MSHLFAGRGRRAAALVVLCASLAVALPWACARRPTGAPLRVVVVLIDTLRRDHLPMYGYAKPTAPFLSRLAGEGVVFEHAYSTSSWTAPSTASLFTSLYPLQHGVQLGMRAARKLIVRDSQQRLNAIPEGAETLPEALRPAGYKSFAITQNINISRALGFAQGFDRFVNMPGDDSADAIGAKLEAWRPRLQEAPRHFLYLHYLDPHSPYNERAPWFDPASTGRARTVSAYDSEIAYVDQHLQRAYEAFGWDRDTLLVVTADHGEEFWEHGSVEHGRTLYGEVVNIPLLMRFPGGRHGGRRVAAAVSLIDVLPTLREAVGLPRSPTDGGQSLLPLVEGRPMAPRTLYVQLWRPEPQSGRLFDLKSSLDNGLKLIEGDARGPLLFDLLADPLDHTSLSAARPDAVARLLGRFALFERTATKQQAAPVAVPLDREAQERLKALGYVE